MDSALYYPHMNTCIFCKIVAHEIPANIIYEDNDVVAFLDNTPINPGHTLVIPKTHHSTFQETPPDTLSKLTLVAQKVSKAVTLGSGASGMNIYINNGKDAGQVVFHTHIHLIPRHSNDGKELWHGTPYVNETVEKSIAENIQKNL